MKIIESYGGPLIGLSRCDVQHWSGIEGKLFIGDASPFSDDYDATKFAMLGDDNLCGYLAKLTGVTCEGLLINTPVRTLVVASDDRSVYLAQIESSETGWSPAMIEKEHFNLGTKSHDKISINVKNGDFILFDSSAPSDGIEDDFLAVDLNEGLYTCESAIYKVKGEAKLILIRMEKI